MRSVIRENGDNIPEIEEITEEVAECPVCGAIIPADAKVCPVCGAVFEEEEEEGGVELEEEEAKEEYGEEEPEEEEEIEGEVGPAKADKKLFWAGLITLLIGSQGVALGSLLHNTLHIYVSVTTYKNGVRVDSATVYGYLDQIAGIIGIVITLIGIVLLIIYMKKQSEEEKYREQLEEEAEKDPEIVIPDDFKEPLVVQNKLFFWIGFSLLLITGPIAVIGGLAGGHNVDQLGLYVGGGGGGILTVLGIILLFLSIWQKKTGEETEEEGEPEEIGGEEGEEEYEEGEEFGEEPEEELEDIEEEEELEE